MKISKAYSSYINGNYELALREYINLSSEYGDNIFVANIYQCFKKLGRLNKLQAGDVLRLGQQSSYDLLRNILRKPVVVSLTSFPERINSVAETIGSILNQSFKPDHLVLWLASEQFPKKEDDLPDVLLSYKSQGLLIEWTEDVKSYKKLIPSLKKYKNTIIVTADDDLIYPQSWLLELVLTHLITPNSIICHRVHEVCLDNEGEILPYKNWPKEVKGGKTTFLNFFTTGAGVLFPPGALHLDVTRRDLFEKLCPTGDDIWVWGMAVRNGTNITAIENSCFELNFVEGTQEIALWRDNVSRGRNDIMMANLLNAYPKILETIRESQENNVRVSVIVPIYNTGVYLEECINSILEQEFDDFELLCVNDGSTDQVTIDILNKFKISDKRVVLINQENSGPASARNNGISRARGKYIVFVDSDDYVSPKYLANMYDSAISKKSDLVFSEKIICFGDGIESYRKKDGVENFGKISNKQVAANVILATGVSCGKMYKKSFLVRNDINYMQGMNCPAEDNFFTIFASIFSCDNVSLANNAYYYYRQHSNSITKNVNVEGFFKSVKVYEAALERLESSAAIDKQYWRNVIVQRAIKDLSYMAKYIPNRDDLLDLINSKFINKIEICCIADRNYINPTLVFIESLKRSKRKINSVHVTVLVPDGDSDVMSILKKTSGGNFVVDVSEVDSSQFLNLHKYKEVGNHCMASPSAMFKFLIPEIFDDIDRILYIDTDLIVRHDLLSVFMTDMEGNYLCAVEDMWSSVTDDPEVKKFDFYFNSGFMLMDLNKMRSDNLPKKFIIEKTNSQNFNLMDQNVFNVVCNGAAKGLDIKYNFLPVCYKRHKNRLNLSVLNKKYSSDYSSIEEIAADPVIVHWAGSDKPWVNQGTLFSNEWQDIFSSAKINGFVI